MKTIFNLGIAAALVLGMSACSNETTSTTTSNVDSTVAPADNTSTGISGGDVNTMDTTGTTGASMSSGANAGGSTMNGSVNTDGMTEGTEPGGRMNPTTQANIKVIDSMNKRGTNVR